MGIQLLKEGLLEQAREMLEQAELRYPGDPEVRQNLSQAYARLSQERFDKGSYLEAEYFAEESLKRNPRQANLWLLLGRTRLNLKNPRGALTALQEANRLKASGVDAYLVEAYGLVALDALQSDNFAEAEGFLAEARKRAPQEPLVLYGYGRLYFARKEYARAVSYFESCRESERFRASSLYYLGRTYAALKQWDLALSMEEEAVTYPEFRADSLRLRAEIQYGWGEELYKKQRYAEVPPHLHDALTLFPDWYEARTLLTRTYLLLGEGEKAREVLTPLYQAKGAIPEVRRLMAEAEIVIGKNLVSSGKLREATQAFQRSLEVDPSYGAAWMPLGRTYEGLKMYAEAVSAYRRSLGFGLETLEANERAMRLLMDKLERPLEALEHAEAVLKIQGSHREAITRLLTITEREGLRAFSNNDFALAKRLFLRHRDFKEDTWEVNTALTEVYLREQAFRLALPLVERLLEHDPRSSRYLDQGYRVFVGIAGEAEASQNYGEAELFLNRALAIRPREHRLWFRLAVAKLKLRKFSESVEIFHRLEKEEPALKEEIKPPLALALVGYAGEVMMENPTRAVALSEEAMAKNPREWSAYPVAASAYEGVKNYPRAIEVLEIYLKEFPSHAQEWQRVLGLYRTYITLLAEKKEHEKVIAYAERLRRYAPDDPLALFQEGMAYLAQGQFEKAEPLLLKVRATPPYGGRAQLELGRGYARRGDPVRATTYYRGARAFDPSLTPVTEEVEVFRSAARILEKEGKLSEEAKLYEYVVQLVPGDPRANYDFGRILRALGRSGEAEPYLKKASESPEPGKERTLYKEEYARVLLDLKRFEPATRILLALEQEGPQNSELKALLLLALHDATLEALLSQRWDLALEFSDLGSARAPQDPFFPLARARALAAKNELPRAVQSYERAYTLNPTDPGVAQEYAQTLIAEGNRLLEEQKWEEAERSFSRSLTLAESAPAYEGLARSSLGKNDLEATYRWLTQLEKKFKLSSSARALKSETLKLLLHRALKENAYPRAITYGEELVKELPQDPLPRYQLGLAYLRNGDPSGALRNLKTLRSWEPQPPLDPSPPQLLEQAYEALLLQQFATSPLPQDTGDLLEEALELFPKNPTFWVMQGKLHNAQGRFKEAGKAWLKAYALDPERSGARELLQELLSQHRELTGELELPPELKSP